MYKIEEIKNTIICGDALLELKKFPDESIDCIITSPPYWGLRDYQVEKQIGLEPILEEYLEKLLKITIELKRILKPRGIMFWNHGDCYGGSGCGKGDYRNNNKRSLSIPKLSKCLALQNWRLILRMIDEQGWILRNTIIWHKPNHMPSSVKDRFTNAYEPVFMLVKNKKYYFDLDAVRVPPKTFENRPYGIVREREFGYNTQYPQVRSFNYRVRDASKKSEQCPQFKATKEEIERYKQTHYPQDQAESFGSPRARYWRKKETPYHPAGDPTIHGQRLPSQPNQEGAFHPLGKNPGDVWEISTQPAPPEVRGKFFAMFPEKLVEPMILAGCPKEGIILDPFFGSGTVGVVAKKLKRNYIGIELSPDYVKIAEARIKNTPTPIL